MEVIRLIDSCKNRPLRREIAAENLAVMHLGKQTWLLPVLRCSAVT